MFSINGAELLIILVIAIVVIGPERMPGYAKQLREWVIGARDYVTKGRDQIEAEVGGQIDWQQLDPRQYDPRRIVREALYEPEPAPTPQRPAAAVHEPGEPAPFDADAT